MSSVAGEVNGEISLQPRRGLKIATAILVTRRFGDHHNHQKHSALKPYSLSIVMFLTCFLELPTMMVTVIGSRFELRQGVKTA